jgi:hypothetical protein
MNNKYAYPNVPIARTPDKKDIQKWKKTAIAIQSFSRVYGKDYTFPQILYHFTKDWDMFERSEFKNWFNWNNKKAQTNDTIVKYAGTVGQDRLIQFQSLRKKLMSRINLTRKALQDFINNGLIEQRDSNNLYKIVAMLEYEAMKLTAPKLLVARVHRTIAQITKLGYGEIGNILISNDSGVIKTATQKSDAVDVLKKLKKEMDTLAYSRHLDTLYNIMKQLEKMGRAGDAELVEKMIRDDLGALEKLNKKLVEIYTNVSKVPLELSEIEDQANPTEVEVEMPIEVSKAPIPPSREPPKKQVQQIAPQTRQIQKPVVETPKPAIDTNIPNI